MNDKIENNLKDKHEDGEYLYMLGGGQDRPDDLRDPLSSETDMKMAKSDNSLHPFDLLLIKLEEGCQKNKDQNSYNIGLIRERTEHTVTRLGTSWFHAHRGTCRLSGTQYGTI